MNINLDLFTILVLFSFVQGIFLSIIFFFIKRGKKPANRIFSLLLLCISLSISTFLILKTSLYIHIPFYVRLFEPVQFLLGPLLIFYIKALTNKKILTKFLFHFLPFIVCSILLIPFFAGSTSSQLGWVERMISSSADLQFTLAKLASIVHMWCYIIYGLVLLAGYRKQLKNHYSYTEKINLSWLRIFLSGMVVVYTLFIIPIVLMLYGHNTMNFTSIIMFIVSLSVLCISYFVIRQSGFFIHIDADPPDVPDKKYKSSPLSDEEINSCWKNLQSLMSGEKSYLSQELTLSQLAEQLKMPRQYVSQIINSCSGQNFYDFVNSYRVEEVKRLIQKPESRKLTLLALAYDAGFNSKASFNSIFKKHTSMTPSEYLKSIG